MAFKDVPKKLFSITPERYDDIKRLKRMGYNRYKVARKLKLNYKSVNLAWDYIEMEGDDVIVVSEEEIEKLVKGDWEGAKKIAADTLLRCLKAGDPAVAKWVMDRGKDSKPKNDGVTGEVFGNDGKRERIDQGE
mgnify:CR=1 FL=1